MQHIKALQERRANIWEQVKTLLDTAEGEKRDLTGEEDAQYQRLNTDLDQIDARVKELVDAEQRTKDADAAFAALLSQPQQRTLPADADSELRRFARGELRSIEIRPEGRWTSAA